MSKEDFIKKYGRNKKNRARFNAAVRAECPGGNELLDLLELVSAMRGRCGSAEELDKLTIIEDKVQAIRSRMVNDVRTRWGIIDDQ